jgi:hypothetical protein
MDPSFYEIGIRAAADLLKAARKGGGINGMRNISGMPAIEIVAPVSTLFSIA